MNFPLFPADPGRVPELAPPEPGVRMRQPALHAPALSHPGESGLSRGPRPARHRTQGSPHSPVSTVADPGSGIRCLFDPRIRNTGSGMGKILGYNQDHISESLETSFLG
jgi:hypothetical protein